MSARANGEPTNPAHLRRFHVKRIPQRRASYLGDIPENHDFANVP